MAQNEPAQEMGNELGQPESECSGVVITELGMPNGSVINSINLEPVNPLKEEFRHFLLQLGVAPAKCVLEVENPSGQFSYIELEETVEDVMDHLTSYLGLNLIYRENMKTSQAPSLDEMGAVLKTNPKS